MANEKRTAQDMHFEQALARLDEILKTLEQENTSLDDMMKLYEEGVGLLRCCNERLEQAEQKVSILKISPDGTRAHLEDFEEATEGSEAKPRTRRASPKKIDAEDEK